MRETRNNESNRSRSTTRTVELAKNEDSQPLSLSDFNQFKIISSSEEAASQLSAAANLIGRKSKELLKNARAILIQNKNHIPPEQQHIPDELRITDAEHASKVPNPAFIERLVDDIAAINEGERRKFDQAIIKLRAVHHMSCVYDALQPDSIERALHLLSEGKKRGNASHAPESLRLLYFSGSQPMLNVLRRVTYAAEHMGVASSDVDTTGTPVAIRDKK